jgi:cell division protein FtsB
LTITGFRVDKTLNLQSLLTAIALVCSLLWWAMGMSSRITVLEEDRRTQRDTNQQLSSENQQLRKEMREDLGAIRENLERLSERR